MIRYLAAVSTCVYAALTISSPAAAQPGWGGPIGPEAPYYGGPGWGGPGPYGTPRMPGFQPLAEPARFRITRSADRDNYYVTIFVTGIEPEEVNVHADGNRLAISARESNQTSAETTDDKQGYYWSRSYSRRSSSLSRRFTMPRDADMEAMQREDGKDQVRITVPRTHSFR